MSSRCVILMGVFVAAVWGVAAFGQESRWIYDRRVNGVTGRESDTLLIRGHYLSPLPSSHGDGTPALMLSCSGGDLDVIVIATGVTIGNEFGASPKIHAQIDDGKPMWDRAVDAIEADSKTLVFTRHNTVGGTDMLFAKEYAVTVESSGKRIVGMEFDFPSDSSPILRYCGLMKPKPPKS